MPGVFSKIITGELPGYRIFEDDLTFAFLDINPINLGHTLIVPKIEVDYFLDLNEPYYSRLFVNAKTIAKALQKATDCLRICTWIEGLAVPHVHYHICPFFDQNEFWSAKVKKFERTEMENIRQKIVQYL